MNRKFINIFRIIGVPLIILSILTGCSNAEDSLMDDIPEINELSPVELVFYMPGEKQEDTDEVLNKVAKATNLNIKLNFKWFKFNTYFDRMQIAFATNEKFDAFLSGQPIPGKINFIDMFRNSQIKDITKLLPEYAPSIYSQLSKEELDSVKVDGKIVLVPPIAPIIDSLGVHVKKDLADKYNISSINTFEDYKNLLKKINDNEENIVSGCVLDGNWLYQDIQGFANVYGYVILDYVQHLVYKWDDPEMKIIPWEQTPEFKEIVNLINECYKNGYIERYDEQKKFASFMRISCNDIGEDVRKFDFDRDGKDELFNYYVLYKDKKMQRKSPASFDSFSAIAFNSNSENTERVLMFLNWIQSSQENYDLFTYGIKDKHYILDGERIGIPKGNKSNDSYGGWVAYMPFFNINYTRLGVNDKAPDSCFKDMAQYINTHAKYAPHEGFYADYNNIQNYCDQRIQLYYNKIASAIFTGNYNTNETDSIIKELKKAGTDKIVQEVQRQLNNWRSN